jgi:hypothetical protein
MSKKIAITQSNYIPWRGYFDMIGAVDEFILYDDMQYTRRDWRNRNQIKTPQGVRWLSIPVLVKGRYHQKIRDTEIDGVDWAQLHWEALAHNYRRAPHFIEIASWLMPLYFEQTFTHISHSNRRFIESICSYLDIKTIITNSSEYTLSDGKTERLADICRQAGGTEYVSGPTAKSYIDDKIFSDLGIKLTWIDYAQYPEYPQLWGDFVNEVTVLDLLFNCGKSARQYMRYLK